MYVTFEKLSNIKIVIVTHNGNIVILVKIPCFTKETYQLIYFQHIPNVNQAEIYIQKNEILSLNGVMYI